MFTFAVTSARAASGRAPVTTIRALRSFALRASWSNCTATPGSVIRAPVRSRITKRARCSTTLGQSASSMRRSCSSSSAPHERHDKHARRDRQQRRLELAKHSLLRLDDLRVHRVSLHLEALSSIFRQRTGTPVWDRGDPRTSSAHSGCSRTLARGGGQAPRSAKRAIKTRFGEAAGAANRTLDIRPPDPPALAALRLWPFRTPHRVTASRTG